MSTEIMLEYYNLPTFSLRYDPTLDDSKWTLLYVNATAKTASSTHMDSYGQMYLMAPGKLRQELLQSVVAAASGICCQFTAYSQWSIWLHRLQTTDSQQPLQIADRKLGQQIEYGLERLMEYGEHAEHPGYRQLSFHLLSELLLLLTVHEQPALQNNSDSRIEEVLHYLQEHYAEDIRIEQLAQLVCLSPSRLSHLYKSHTGETIMDTLIRLRLERAQHLLASTCRYVGEIAYEVGFNSQTYFTCKFTRHFGISPSLYRSSLNPSGGCASSS
ncbi:AraC family transcriptional regulator [Paenibacillus hunanensis]|uniref:helix-turn-helix domain-containing protein n=1 Tax=Paenibacillus hunanensis TaxID=539262 RepID=UPI002026C83F|nr:AraC family transcriptional regulator [Paenibacillus hunanensis]MCL9659558.1 AraC family transcriptional regulator [Paenibacillus hunanensis]WPP40595.1 AraC family transcriptional regulator [Paenibacillus hunanensis]